MRATYVLAVLASLLLISPSTPAQKASVLPADEVSFYVTVTNQRGEWIGGLTSNNFKIREGKSEHEITSFSSDETPVSVGILIDTSGSTLAYLKKIPEAMSYFMKASKQETDMFVMLFNTQQAVVVEPTSNRDELMKTLLSLNVAPKGNTALFDAIDAGLTKLSKGKHAKKALIVFSDAQDNASKLSFGDIKQKVRRSGALIYNINLRDADDRSQLAEKSMSWIETLTGMTGGRAMYVIRPGELFDFSYRTGEELRYQYKVGFKPTDVRPDEWRKFGIKLEVAPGVRSRFGEMKIRAREGYYYEATSIN